MWCGLQTLSDLLHNVDSVYFMKQEGAGFFLVPYFKS